MASAVKLLAQLLIYGLSALETLILLPFFIFFWLWSAVTDYSGIVSKKRDSSAGDDPSTSAKWGRHGFLRLKDVRIHYVEAGDRRNELILCLHGFPEFWYSWRHQLVEFSTNHWVVAIDLRGYGESDKPKGKKNYTMDAVLGDVKQIIHALGRDSCIVFGHDWGAGLGWQLVCHHPELVSRYVAMNCPHPAAFVDVISKSASQMFASWYIVFFQLPAVPEILLTVCNGALFRWLFHEHQEPTAITSQDTAAYLKRYTRPEDLTCALNYYRNLVDEKPPPTNPVTVPTLLIWGCEDRYLHRSMASATAKYVKKFSLAYIPGASHWVQQDSPAIVNERIWRFLRQSWDAE